MYDFFIILFLAIAVLGIFFAGVIIATDEINIGFGVVSFVCGVILLSLAVCLSYEAGMKSIVEKKYCETCFSVYRNGESYCERDGSELISMEELIND